MFTSGRVAEDGMRPLRLEFVVCNTVFVHLSLSDGRRRLNEILTSGTLAGRVLDPKMLFEWSWRQFAMLKLLQ